MLKNKFLQKVIFFYCIFLSSVYALNLDELKNNALKEVKVINTDELVTLLKKNPNTKIIDVREKDEILNKTHKKGMKFLHKKNVLFPSITTNPIKTTNKRESNGM